MVDLATTLVPAAPGGRGGPVVVDQAPSPVSALDEGILEWHRRGYPVTAAPGVTPPPKQTGHDGHEGHGH